MRIGVPGIGVAGLERGQLFGMYEARLGKKDKA
jgi:hypothetical protein